MVNKEYGSLIIRVFLGISFIVAGLDKILGWEMVKGMFGTLFGSAGTALLVLAVLIEIIGGLALLTGFYTRYAAGILAILILVAFIKTFQLGQAANIIGTLREIMVMNTGGGNTAVNFAYFAGLLSLWFTGSRFKAVRPE